MEVRLGSILTKDLLLTNIRIGHFAKQCRSKQIDNTETNSSGLNVKYEKEKKANGLLIDEGNQKYQNENEVKKNYFKKNEI